MAKNLIIVESPTKAKTIGKFLGKDYKIMASVGHLRDLPKSRMGVDIENNFEPQYINVRGKAKTINDIKKEASKAENIYLASDPDREGEAIAWHLSTLLNLDLNKKNRVIFHEITKETVKQAVKNPRTIDSALVDAQQARRVMDRIVGYELSPILWKKIKSGLSAGRVQSVALKLIVDREREIQNFIPEEYWSVELKSKYDDIEFEAKYFGKKIDNKFVAIKLNNEQDANNVLENVSGKEFTIFDKSVTSMSRKAYAPFTTSTLQQEASKRINFSTSKTMSVAQQLYEGVYIGEEGTVGLISYMRTDSTRLSQTIVDEALEYIINNFGKQYSSGGNNYSKKKANSQDAHEAVRVSSINRTPDKVRKYLSDDQFKLYRLIWERTIASQMSNSKYFSTKYELICNDEVFKITGSVLQFDGFSKVWKISDSNLILPNFEKGEIIKADEVLKNQHFTKPKSRYTEAALVKTLEENGIGRPSTYSSIIKSILGRNYVAIENKSLYPTEMGFLVCDLLLEYFSSIINEEFTAQMEENLDKIEDRKLEWKNLIREFYEKFKIDLGKAKNSSKSFELEVQETGDLCPLCSNKLIFKQGRNGKFIGCSGFPKCTFTKPIVKDLGVNCPRCGGKIVEKISKRGKVFYGCENYPNCEWASWDKPTGEICEKCGDLMVHRKNRKIDTIICNNEKCKD